MLQEKRVGSGSRKSLQTLVSLVCVVPFNDLQITQGSVSSEIPTVAQEASNISARASLDGVLTRSTASILNATRYCLS